MKWYRVEVCEILTHLETIRIGHGFYRQVFRSFLSPTDPAKNFVVFRSLFNKDDESYNIGERFVDSYLFALSNWESSPMRNLSTISKELPKYLKSLENWLQAMLVEVESTFDTYFIGYIRVPIGWGNHTLQESLSEIKSGLYAFCTSLIYAILNAAFLRLLKLKLTAHSALMSVVRKVLHSTAWTIDHLTKPLALILKRCASQSRYLTFSSSFTPALNGKHQLPA